MEGKEKDLSCMCKEAWQEGYDAAIQKIRIALKLRNMGISDCEIVRRTGLPPVVIHGMFGEHGHEGHEG